MEKRNLPELIELDDVKFLPKVLISHRLEAHEDSTLLVVRAGQAPVAEEELDLRLVPRAERHPLVFAKFDGLIVGDSSR